MTRLDIEIMMDRFQGEVCAKLPSAMVVGYLIGLAKSRRNGRLYGTIETNAGTFYQTEIENISCMNITRSPSLLQL